MISKELIALLTSALIVGCQTMRTTRNFDRQQLYRGIAMHRSQVVDMIDHLSTAQLNHFLIPEHTPLDVAVAHRNRVAAELLIKKGVDVNRGSADGSTPLHSAVWGNSQEMVRLLLDAGANPNKKNRRHGETPLDLAFYEDSQAAAAVLKRFDAKFAKVLVEEHNATDAGEWLKALESPHSTHSSGAAEESD